MINKRLLIKNLLAYNSENSFYDKKEFITIGTKEGKAKFLKHVCALANSNPYNRSFIVIGVTDKENTIKGVDFFDDAKIQNLVNAYLKHPPIVSYENIHFPNLTQGKVIGLVTIFSVAKVCMLKKNIWKYTAGAVFVREGSVSLPKQNGVVLANTNKEVVAAIELKAQNNIKLTLDGVVDFLNVRHKDLECHYQVFKDLFVVCWAGVRKKIKGKSYFSRVDIALITEQVKLFYSDLDEVVITHNAHSFTIVEYVTLGLGLEQEHYPLEKTQIIFKENGSYTIGTTLLFSPPLFDQKLLHHVFNNAKAILERIPHQPSFSAAEVKNINQLPETLLLCYLNGFLEAKELLDQHKGSFKGRFPLAYKALKESLRILRKVKYN